MSEEDFEDQGGQWRTDFDEVASNVVINMQALVEDGGYQLKDLYNLANDAWTAAKENS